MGPVMRGRPLPLEPAGSVRINHAAQLLENEQGGAVFIYGMATWCYEPGDVVGRRLAAVQLVETDTAGPTEVAAAFGVEFETLRRWRRAWAEHGVEGLIEKRRGPRAPFKLVPEVRSRIVELRSKKMSLRAIGAEVGLDASTVRRALLEVVTEADERVPPPSGELEPLARPADRSNERALARAGLLSGAEPAICEGASLPFAGALLVLPALSAGGLLSCFQSIYASGRAAFYSLQSLLLSLVFLLLIGECRAEGLTRLDPVDLGRLIGLDRAPEVKTMRRRLGDLAQHKRSAELLGALARHHLARDGADCSLFYLDGHVRAYHGAARLPKAHLARARLSAPGELDSWLCDASGNGVLVWSSEPGASLSGELARATAEIRALLGKGATPTVVFDRGGYSPKLFAELIAAGFHFITYRKKPIRPEPRSSFVEHAFIDDLGREKTYLLADRRVRLTYRDENKRSRRLELRQVTRLDNDSGHQTQILSDRDDLQAPQLAQAMFSRWRQENFFRYMRHNYGLDALDSYAKTADDATRTVPNPDKKRAAKAVREAKAAVLGAEAAVTRTTLSSGSSSLDALQAAQAALEAAKAHQRAVPARVALGVLHDDAMRTDPERKRLHDAVRMATYNATSALARLIAPHYRRAEDEARMVLHEAFSSPADLEVVGDELHVSINPLSAPRRSRAISGLCEELNATETLYPGTKLRLVYRVKGC
jgi:transposase